MTQKKIIRKNDAFSFPVLFREPADCIGGFQPISRDIDNKSETNKCWWMNRIS